ncbi:sodium/proline symporter PutP [Corynebacterium yudongzhengii]|uniref:Sodium/proline symporter n=1 Tax=Corynebacterium yudongzhengii TaxID=2080740 RepID=A0A2U1T9E7_9CORY|nr:sodium/proline symporter PutP [Corynebacterium yudongzhengii]AWB82140.1 sodium/proline symporter PutP [Corynebacterium yudongzhengii]PWC02644.1 sodium/proline symporter PutP [Corynebacterium yudongzhengii]
MQESTWFIIAIVIYLLVMLLIGLWGYRQTKAYDDYAVGGRGLPPFVAALSAGASDMSGWLLMGLPGALYLVGLAEAWMAIGLTIGAWANWKLVAPRLRSYSEIAGNSITMPSFFENRLRDKSHLLRTIAAIIIIFFFTFYVASGMVAGGRYFEATFDGNYLTGMLIVAAVTILYTFFGGFLAVSYTDVVQGLMMFMALMIVPIMALFALDNPSDMFTWATDNAYGPYGDEGNPTYFNMFAGVSAAVIISNLAWGLGYFGQPHIVVRFLALRSPKDARAGRFWGISWMGLSLIGGLFVAMIGTAFFGQNPDIQVTDQENFETIFLDMSRILFHPLIAGLVLTAVLAAIMSTMSSQLLVVSSSLIEDLYRMVTKTNPSDKFLVFLSRGAVVVIAAIALLLSINPSDSILGLVGFAWAGFGSAFGPLVIASLYWKRLTAPGAIVGMVSGAITAIIWGMFLGDVIYEIVPGVIVSTILMVVVSLMTKEPDERVRIEFDQAAKLSNAVKVDENIDFSEEAERIDAEDNRTN